MSRGRRYRESRRWGSRIADVGGFHPGAGAELRSSTNYLIADTLGQFVVGESAAPDDSYARGRIEHGFRHSDVHIPTIAEIKGAPNNQWVDAYAKLVTAVNGQFYRTFYIEEQDRTNAIRVNVGTNPTISVAPGDMVDVSGLLDGVVIDEQTMRGLRLSIANLATGNTIAPPSVGQYVSVIGICAPQSIAGGRIVAQIRPRNQDDITVPN